MANRTKYNIAAEPLQATGIINEGDAYQTAEERAALPAGSPRPRATVSPEDPRVTVDVECARIVENFGKRITDVFSVRVPDSAEARDVKLGPVSFTGLSVTVSVPKQSNQLRENWAAEGIATGTARRTGGE